MSFRVSIAVVAWICAQGTLSASTSYSFGNGTQTTFDAGGYQQGVWTEDYTDNNGSGTNEQIVCVVGVGITTYTCGDTGLGTAQDIPIYTPGTPPSGLSNYVEIDGDPAYGAPISTSLSGLSTNTLYTISFFQASNEEGGNDKAYNDNWLVYFIPGATSGSYICPNTVCTGTGGEPSSPALPNGAILIGSSPVMNNLGEESTPWQDASVTFNTGTATGGILEFVTQAEAVTAGNFEPPLLDLALVTSQQGAPEPGTWVLTLIGAGLVFVSGFLRRRTSHAYKRVRIERR